MVTITSIAIFALQSAIFVLFVVAVRERNTAAAVNALGALLLSVLPSVVAVASQPLLARSVTVGHALPAWLAVAGVLHSLGMLGQYESTWWWDHLTHVVSAALVAAFVYAALVVTHPGPVQPTSPGTVLATVTALFTFTVGIFWELVELVARDVGERFDVEPVLVYYGRRDTALDLVFDVVGALLIVGVDLRLFVPLVEQYPEATRAMLVGSGWLVLGGSVLLALVVGLGNATRG